MIEWKMVNYGIIREYDDSNEPVYELDENNNILCVTVHTFSLMPPTLIVPLITVEITEKGPDPLDRWPESYSIKVNYWNDWCFLGTLEEAKKRALDKVNEFLKSYLNEIEKYLDNLVP